MVFTWFVVIFTWIRVVGWFLSVVALVVFGSLTMGWSWDWRSFPLLFEVVFSVVSSISCWFRAGWVWSSCRWPVLWLLLLFLCLACGDLFELLWGDLSLLLFCFGWSQSWFLWWGLVCIKWHLSSQVQFLYSWKKVHWIPAHFFLAFLSPSTACFLSAILCLIISTALLFLCLLIGVSFFLCFIQFLFCVYYFSIQCASTHSKQYNTRQPLACFHLLSFWICKFCFSKVYELVLYVNMYLSVFDENKSKRNSDPVTSEYWFPHRV